MPKFLSKLLVASPPLPEHMKSKIFYHGTAVSDVEKIKSFVQKGIIPNFNGGNYSGATTALKGRAYVTPDFSVAKEYSETTGRHQIIMTISGNELLEDVIPDEDSVVALIGNMYKYREDMKISKDPEFSKLNALIKTLPEEDQQKLSYGVVSVAVASAKKLLEKMNDELKLWILQLPGTNIAHEGTIKPEAIYLIRPDSDSDLMLDSLLWNRSLGYTQLYKTWDRIDKGRKK